MKKLMIAASAAVCATVGVCVESSNIVGYQTTDNTGNQYVSLGATFVSTGADGTFKLSDLVLNGGDASSDNIQVLEPVGATVSDTFVYVSAAQAAEWGDASFQGWYDFSMENSKDNETFDLGQGFLGNFTTKAVVSTSAGQVHEGSFDIDCTGKQYVMFANPLPRQITLGELVLTGGDASSDNIQVLEPAGATVSATYVYVSAAQAVEWGDAGFQGWYDFSMENSMNDVTVAAGTAFLANFTTKNVTITFPAAL